MIVMLCRNRVEDFQKWRRIFDSNTQAALQAGLRLTHLWQNIDDPNDIFFLFEVADVERAQAFLNDPESEETGRRAGVIDGECYFLSGAPTD